MNKKGNLLITFILIVSLAAVVGSISYLTAISIKTTRYVLDRQKAFYIAEAGLEKAIWYFKTPIGDGGKGEDWRTTGSTESFSEGSYTFYVGGAIGGDVTITSEGTYQGKTRTIQVRYHQYSPGYDYAVFSRQNIQLKNNATVYGDIFADGDVDVAVKAKVLNGVIITTEGHVVTGSGVYTIGTMPDPIPTTPIIDTTYYYTEIATALASSTVDYTYNGSLNLAGSTIYANNNINIEGTIIGPGALVAGNDIYITGTTTIGQDIEFIAGHDLEFENGCAIDDDNNMFADNRIYMNNNINGDKLTIICSHEVEIRNNSIVTGLIFAGQLSLYNNVDFSGNIQTEGLVSDNIFGNNSTITYSADYLPSDPPPGVTAEYNLEKNSWKEL